MYVLDTTTRSLELYNNTLNTQHYYEVSYVDITTTTATPGLSTGRTATTAANYNTICAAPAASTQRIIKSIIIRPGGGTGGADRLWNLYINDNGTRYALLANTAAGISSWYEQGVTHTYTDQTGWTTHLNTGSSGNIIASPFGRFCQPLRPVSRLANISATIALADSVSRATYIGPVNYGANAVVVQFRVTTNPSTLTWVELAICQGDANSGSDVTLYKLGSMAWDQMIGVGVKTFTIPITWRPDPTKGNDLYLVIGVDANTAGTLRGGLADDLTGCITGTATVRPSAITPPSGLGTNFSLSGSTIVVPLIQAMYI